MTRTTHILILLGWTLWGLVFVVLLSTFVYELVHPTSSPEVSRGLGIIVVGFLLVVFAGVGLCLFWATRRRSTAWLIVLTLLLAYLVFILVAPPLVRAWKIWRIEREVSWSEERSDPEGTLSQMGSVTSPV